MESVIQVAMALIMLLLVIIESLNEHNLVAVAIIVAIWLGLAYFVSYVFKDRSPPRRRIRM